MDLSAENLSAWAARAHETVVVSIVANDSTSLSRRLGALELDDQPLAQSQLVVAFQLDGLVVWFHPEHGHIVIEVLRQVGPGLLLKGIVSVQLLENNLLNSLSPWWPSPGRSGSGMDPSAELITIGGPRIRSKRCFLFSKTFEMRNVVTPLDWPLTVFRLRRFAGGTRSLSEIRIGLRETPADKSIGASLLMSRRLPSPMRYARIILPPTAYSQTRTSSR
jgi:hypothetical protein